MMPDVLPVTETGVEESDPMPVVVDVLLEIPAAVMATALTDPGEAWIA
jgi:hypothetical protein